MLRRSVGENVRYGFIPVQDRTALNLRFERANKSMPNSQTLLTGRREVFQ